MTSAEIQKIYQEFKVPANIIAHMRVVSEVASKIAKKLISNNVKIDQETIVNAALLHDTLRIVDIKEERLYTLAKNPDELKLWLHLKEKYKEIGHEKAMAEVLRNRGEEKLAQLIGKHGFFEVHKLQTLEEKIVYYADKRVDHDKIVDLKKRFDEGKKRNALPGDDQAFIKETEQKVFALEKELSNLLLEDLNTFIT